MPGITFLLKRWLDNVSTGLLTCFRRRIPSGSIPWGSHSFLVGLFGNGPRAPCAAAATAGVIAAAATTWTPTPRHWLSRRLPLLQRHSGVWRPTIARGATGNPSGDAGGHYVGLKGLGVVGYSAHRNRVCERKKCSRRSLGHAPQ